MTDNDPGERINELIAEERALRAQAIGTGLREQDRTRLRDLEQQLNQCWDLLRRRRALAEFQEDPDQARTRPTSEVESYQQ